MDTGTLNVLHNTRDQDIVAITYCIDLDLLTLQIFIYQDRMILCDPVDDADKFFHIFIIDSDLHTLAAKYIRRTNQYRVTKTVGNLFCFLCSIYGSSLWSRDLALLQDLIKQLSVLSRIYIFCGSTKDRHTHLHQSFGQFDSGLSTKLYYRSIRFFQTDNALHILRCQRLKIQFICNIEVCTYGLRVVIDNDGLISFFGECPGTMY